MAPFKGKCVKDNTNLFLIFIMHLSDSSIPFFSNMVQIFGGISMQTNSFHHSCCSSHHHLGACNLDCCFNLKSWLAVSFLTQ